MSPDATRRRPAAAWTFSDKLSDTDADGPIFGLVGPSPSRCSPVCRTLESRYG